MSDVEPPHVESPKPAAAPPPGGDAAATPAPKRTAGSSKKSTANKDRSTLKERNPAKKQKLDPAAKNSPGKQRPSGAEPPLRAYVGEPSLQALYPHVHLSYHPFLYSLVVHLNVLNSYVESAANSQTHAKPPFDFQAAAKINLQVVPPDKRDLYRDLRYLLDLERVLVNCINDIAWDLTIPRDVGGCVHRHLVIGQARRVPMAQTCRAVCAWLGCPWSSA